VKDDGGGDRRGGWVFYDGECSMCAALAARWKQTLRDHGFELVPLQARGVCERLGVTPDELRSQMWVLARDGRLLGGADAAFYVARKTPSTWWAWALIAVGALPGGMRVIRWAYRWVAAHRRYFGTCALGDPGSWPADGDAGRPAPRS